MALRAVLVHAEPRHHLVKAEEGPVRGRQVAAGLEEGLRGRDEAGVADDRLQDDARDLARVGRKGGLEGGDVVVLDRQGAGCRALGHARRVGQAQRGHARPGLHQEGVAVAVVAAHEFQHLLPPRERTHQAEDGQAGLRARIHHAHHLHARHAGDDGFGHLVLQGAGRAEGCAFRQLGDQRLPHLRVGVTHDGRAPGADVVDERVAVDVDAAGPLHPVEDDGLAADRLEGTDRGVDAAGQQVLGLGEDLK